MNAISLVISRIKQDWKDLLRFLLGDEPEPVIPIRITFDHIDQDVDWFVWESEQIQRGGYVFWFDHWRYDGQQQPYPEPTDEQWRKVVESSRQDVLRNLGKERLDRALEALQRNEVNYPTSVAERRRMVGQHPSLWVIRQAELNR